MTYSEISEDELDICGIIFIKGRFVKSSFVEKVIQCKIMSEKDKKLQF